MYMFHWVIGSWVQMNHIQIGSVSHDVYIEMLVHLFMRISHFYIFKYGINIYLCAYMYLAI